MSPRRQAPVVPALARVLLTGEAAGGGWRRALDLARGFTARGVETVLALLGPGPPPAFSAQAARVSGLHVVRLGLPTDAAANNEEELREAGAALAGLAARVRADSVHLHTPAFAAEVAWPVPVVAQAQGDVGTWWKATHRGELPPDLAWRAAAVARGLAEADVVVAPTRAHARALTWLYRPGRPIDVVPLGRAHVPAPPCTRRAAVLACGRLADMAFNAPALERAASLLEAPVLLAGDTSETAMPADPAPALRLLGRLDPTTLALRMAEATVFVAPVRYAPFGLSVLEAAHSGLALALADIPSLRELWDGAAVFFHPEDPAAMSYALRRLLSRPEPMAARARAVADRLTVARMADATLALHMAAVSGQVA